MKNKKMIRLLSFLNEWASKEEGGLLLIVSMFMLVLLSLLGISAMTKTTVEEQIVSSEKLAKLSFYSADSGGSGGLGWLVSVYNIAYHPTNLYSTPCSSTAPCTIDPNPSNVTNPYGFASSTTQTAGGSYSYQIVSLDPSPSLPATYTAKPRMQQTKGFSSKLSSGYAGSTRVYSYYYLITGSGAGPNNLSSSTVYVVASYLSEN